MNHRQMVAHNAGRLLQLRPVPLAMNLQGKLVPTKYNEWRVSDAGQKRITINNIVTGHSLVLEPDNIAEFRSPNFLILRCRLMLDGRRIHIEPIVRSQQTAQPGDLSCLR